MIQLKILNKYEDFITIILSQIWGNEPRNKKCKEYVKQYLGIIKKIVEEGISKGQIKNVNPETITLWIFSTTYVSLLYKTGKEDKVNINDIYKQLEDILFKGITN